MECQVLDIQGRKKHGWLSYIWGLWLLPFIIAPCGDPCLTTSIGLGQVSLLFICFFCGELFLGEWDYTEVDGMGIGSIYSPPFVAGRHCLYQRAPGGSWCMRRVRQLCGGSETFLDMMWGNCFKLYNDATDKLSVFFVTYYFYTGIIKLNSPTVGIGGSNLKQCKSLVIFRDDLDVPCILCISFGVCYKIMTAAGFISYNRFFADPTSTLGDDDRRNRLGSSLKVLVMGRINPQKKNGSFFPGTAFFEVSAK